MIAAVTFDFWETLVYDTPENLSRQRAERIAGLAALAARAGHPLPLSEMASAYDHSQSVLESRFWNQHRDLDHREQVRIVLDCAVPGLPARLGERLFEEAVVAYISPVLASPPELNPGAAEAVLGLRARGVILGIVSNTGRTPGLILRRVLERHDLLRHFAVISYSDEVGHRKPSAEIFRRTLAGAGADPAGAAHVGDNPVDDVAGAQAMGMRGVHYAARGRPPSPHADLVVAHLADLPRLLVGG
jgi:putative hydrolase of the HAD superfamily